MRYKCYDCGKRFSVPKVVNEMLGYYGNAPYFEPFAYCPHCDGDCIEEYENDKVKTKDQYFVRKGELLYNDINDQMFMIDAINEDDVEMLVVKRGEDGEPLLENGEYVCGDSFVFTRDYIEETMEGM